MNKKTMILSLVAVFATTLLLNALMFTTKAAPAGNPRASGGGTAEEDGEKSTFVFNAIQNNNGTVNGHLVYNLRSINASIKVKLDCLTIVGNNAIMSGVITHIKEDNPPASVFVGQRVEFQVEDNGEGGDDSPDLISDVWLGGTASCNLIAPTPYLPIDGNIQVQP